MSGPDTSKQDQITQQNLNVSQKQEQQSEEQYQQYKTLTAPAIQKYTALAGGDRNAAVAAAAPEVGTIAGGYDAAKAQIMNSLPPGAARDKALADLQVSKYSATSGVLASEVQKAPDILANIGAGSGAFSLQEVGATLSGLSGASSSNQAVMQAQNAAKANTVGLVSGLAGGAGQALAGSFKIPSDRRLKKNIRRYQPDMRPVMDKLLQLQCYMFDYEAGATNQVGVIAQELQEQLPELVSEIQGGYLAVDYPQLAVYALSALRMLRERIVLAEEAHA